MRYVVKCKVSHMAKRSHHLAPISCCLLLALSAATPLTAQDNLSKLDSALRSSLQSGSNADVSVIVRMQPGYRGTVRNQQQAEGRSVKAEHALINAITMRVPVNALAGLTSNPNILSISINARLEASQAPAPPLEWRGVAVYAGIERCLAAGNQRWRRRARFGYLSVR